MILDDYQRMLCFDTVKLVRCYVPPTVLGLHLRNRFISYSKFTLCVNGCQFCSLALLSTFPEFTLPLTGRMLGETPAQE